MAIHPTEHDISEPRKATGVDQATLFDMPSQSEGGPTDALSESTESVVVPDTPAQLVEDNNNLLAETSSPVAPLADTTRTSRVSFLGNVLNTRAKQATAAGLAVAALGGGIWAANRGDNDPSVHAATPVATSTPNTPSATETATTQPAPSTSEATPTTEAPTPTVGETTPSTELGTLPPISLSLLKSQIDPQKNQELLDTYFDLSDRANLVAHFKYSIGDEVTDQGIALKQKQLQKLLRNKGVQDILGGKGILTAESAKKAADNGTLGNEIVMYSENASNQAINIAEAKLGISLADAVDGALMSTELEQGLIGNFQPLYDRNERPTYYTLPEKSYIFDAEQYNVIPYHDKSAMFVGVVTIMSADKQGKHAVWYTENYLMPIGNGQFVGMRYYAHKYTQ